MDLKKLPLLLMASALLLSSCGGDDADVSSSYSNPAETGTSEIASSSSLSDSSDPDPDDDPIGTTTEPEEITTETAFPTEYDSWPGDLVNERMKEVLGTDLTLAAPSSSLDSGRTYILNSGFNYDSSYYRYYIVRVTASGDFTTYADEVQSQGWLEPAQALYTNARFLNSEDLSLELLVYDYDSVSDCTIVDVRLSMTGYYAVWPEQFIAETMDEMLDEGYTALPSIEGTIYGFAVEDGVPWIYVYGVTETEYEAILLDNGFVTGVISTRYFDPKFEYYVTPTQQDGNYITISIRKVDGSDYYHNTWDTITPKIEEAYAYFGGTGFEATFPFIGIDFSYAYVALGTNSFQMYILRYDEGVFVNLFDIVKPMVDADPDWLYLTQTSHSSYEQWEYTDAKTGTTSLYVRYRLSDNALYIRLASGSFSSYVRTEELTGEYEGTASSEGLSVSDGSATITLNSESGAAFDFDLGGEVIYEATGIRYTYYPTLGVIVFELEDGAQSLDYNADSRMIAGTFVIDGNSIELSLYLKVVDMTGFYADADRNLALFFFSDSQGVLWIDSDSAIYPFSYVVPSDTGELQIEMDGDYDLPYEEIVLDLEQPEIRITLKGESEKTILIPETTMDLTGTYEGTVSAYEGVLSGAATIVVSDGMNGILDIVIPDTVSYTDIAFYYACLIDGTVYVYNEPYGMAILSYEEAGPSITGTIKIDGMEFSLDATKSELGE